MNRTNILRDPGQVTFGGATFFSGEGPITVDVSEAILRPPSDGFGPLDPRGGSRVVEVKMPLVGEFESLGVLFPYHSTAIGTDIFGSSDSALVVYGRTSGRKITIHNAAVTGMPTLRLGHDKTIFGGVTFTGLLRKDYTPQSANAYFTETSDTYPGDSAFSAAAIKTLGYQAAWGGSSPWDVFHTADGWEVANAIETDPVFADGLGEIGRTLKSVSAEAKCTPIGPTVADILTARELQGNGTTNYLGAAKTLTNLNITNIAGGSLVYIRLANAIMETSGFNWGASANQIGECVWRASRTVTSGTLDRLFAVGTAAP